MDQHLGCPSSLRPHELESEAGSEAIKHGILLSCTLLLFSSPVAAQGYLLLSGGLSFPITPDEFTFERTVGFNGGIGLGYRFSRHLTVQVLLNYDAFLLDEQRFFDDLFEGHIDLRSSLPNINVEGAEKSFLSFSGELKVLIIEDLDRISPYVIGGGGIARIWTADGKIWEHSPLDIDDYDPIRLPNIWLKIFNIDETIEGEPESSSVMATCGGGVDIPFSERLVIFVEGRYQLYFTSDERTSFISFRGGLQIGF